ncbi:TetR/AcrR family transcriptional regulator [Streptococcus cameli]
MDIRSQKTREAIFEAFFDLLNQANFRQISVAQIIERARIGRSTFYSHFTSKDDLLFAVTDHLFQHVFETSSYHEHVHQESGLTEDSLLDLLTHLFQHFKDNEGKVATLFKLDDDYFKRSFVSHLKTHLVPLVREDYFKTSKLPDSLIQEQITGIFLTCLRWWLDQKEEISARAISFYYLGLLA